MGSKSNNYVVLEITLISAQGLKEPSAKHGRMQTYAVAWINPSVKLRTSVARVGGQNPSWNDKFLFKVPLDFLQSETSGVSVEILAVGVLRDTLLGSVRLLVSNFVRSVSYSSSASSSKAVIKTPSASDSFRAVHIRRRSGRFHGVLNVAVSVLEPSDVPPAMKGVSAISVRDLIGKTLHSKSQRGAMKKSESTVLISGEENSFRDSDDESVGYESTSSSASSSAATTTTTTTNSTALKEWNGGISQQEEMESRNQHVRCSSEGGVKFLCGFGLGFPPMKSACLGSFILNQSLNED